MAPLTEHQAKRIRTATAKTVARMVDQERYWSPEALRAILNRVEDLNEDNPSEAAAAGRAALGVLGRIREPSPDLRLLTKAVYGSALRRAGQVDQALALYQEARTIPGTSPAAQCGVLQRIATAQLCSGDLDSGLRTIAEALRLKPEDPMNQAVRGFLRMVAGDLIAALDDCLSVLESGDLVTDDRPVISAVVNAANILSFASMSDVEQSVVDRIRMLLRRCGGRFPAVAPATTRPSVPA